MRSATLTLGSALLLMLFAIQGYSQHTYWCPTKRFRQWIGAGVDAKAGRYPYATSLQKITFRANNIFKPTDHFCGGVLIDKDLVITAAHCVHPLVLGAEPHPIVQIGGLDLGEDPDAEKHTSCRTILHQDYNPRSSTDGYDIALIELNSNSTKTPLKIDRHIGSKVEGNVRVIGWGKGVYQPYFVTLQEANINVVNNTVCRRQLRFAGIKDSMMCAQGKESDACKGDSGGPLIKAGKGCGENDLLIGVVSVGIKCSDGLGKFPGIYTRIHSFIDWIDKRGKGESIVYEDLSCDEL